MDIHFFIQIKLNNFIMTQPKRMSLTLFAKCGLKEELDGLLHSDYRFLNQHENQRNAIMGCQLTKNNHLIKEYIQVVEEEYNVPNPLAKPASKCSSRKKLELSILGSSKDHYEAKNHDKNRKKLSLATPMKEPELFTMHAKAFSYENMEIMTPKFPYHQSEKGFQQVNQHRDSSLLNPNNKIHASSTNKLASKEKPRNDRLVQSKNGSNSTAKKQAIPNSNESSILHFNHNFQSRATIKRQVNGSDSMNQADRFSQSNDSSHYNPIISKIHKKKLDDYCRPGRISNSIVNNNQPQKKLKIKESYRYCIGCELAVLQANIRSHEKECRQFQQISLLPTNRDVLKVVKAKIALLQARIPSKSQEIQEDHIETLRNRSASLVRESKNRGERSPESKNFRSDFQSIMTIGQKFCNSLEEVNKLRWFTRIALKLQEIIAQEQ